MNARTLLVPFPAAVPMAIVMVVSTVLTTAACGGKLTHPTVTDGGFDVETVTPVPVDTGTDVVPTVTDTGVDAAPPCVAGIACTDGVGACALGVTACDPAGRSRCTVSGSMPAGTVCPGGACDATGRCIPPAMQRSCPDPTERGCGMVDIPGATFTLGDPDALRAAPVVHGITVTDYRIDAYEVSVARFRRYWSAGHPAPVSVAYTDGVQAFTGAVTEPATGMGCTWSTVVGAREAHPVNCVDWYTAVAFCAWDGGHLATEAEWEHAARGAVAPGVTDGRSYPWGEARPTATCDRVQWARCPGDDGAPTRRVGSFAPAAGMYDQAGNLWEWTADLFRPYDDTGCWGARPRSNPRCEGPVGFRAIRGGAWYSVEMQFLRGGSRDDAYEPSNRSAFVGLRCARAR